MLISLARLEIGQAVQETRRQIPFICAHTFSVTEIIDAACRHELRGDFLLRLRTLSPRASFDPRWWGATHRALMIKWYKPERTANSLKRRGFLEISEPGVQLPVIRITSAGLDMAITRGRLASRIVDLDRMVRRLKKLETDQ